jgi:DMSO reductase anchor subunit
MNDNFISLVFFTILCQTAIGALIFRGLTLLFNDYAISFETGRITLISILILFAISLAIAFLHLGKPLHAINALNNIGRSWLSREILSLSLVVALTFIFSIILSKNNSNTAEPVFFALSVISGSILLFSMIRIYMVPEIISWYNPYTAISFIITSFLCGLSFLMLFYYKFDSGLHMKALTLIAFFIISSYINSVLYHRTFSDLNYWLFVVRSIASLISFLIVIIIFFNPGLNKMFSVWVLLFIIIISSEIISRYIFFLSFEKSGL